MKNKFINFSLFIVNWAISYYVGDYLGSAFDNVLNWLDILAALSGLVGMYFFYKGVMQWK